MLITDVICIEDVIYSNNKFYIDNKHSKRLLNGYISNYENVDIAKKLEGSETYDESIDNMFVMTTFHSCFSHALMDCLFAYYWGLHDHNMVQKVKCFIRQSEIVRFPRQNKKHIDESKTPCQYVGVYNDFMKMITKTDYIFEHMNKK